MKENIEEEKAIKYYQNKEISFSVDFDTKKLLEALGITEEDSFENHQIRFKTLLNLIEKLQKENEELKRANKCYINSIHSIVPVLNQDYIEKQKIKDKIEELEPELKFEITEREARLQIKLLKSLLEEES